MDFALHGLDKIAHRLKRVHFPVSAIRVQNMCGIYFHLTFDVSLFGRPEFVTGLPV